MIVDTTYLLPLVGISVNSDLFSEIAKGSVNFDLDKALVSEISLFEIQAKCAKLSISYSVVKEAIKAIRSNFEVVPYDEERVIRTSFELRKAHQDYIDCVIVASAVARSVDLLTEDQRILSFRKQISAQYGISVHQLSQLQKQKDTA